jgi:putative addiction module killer protein
MRPLAWFADTLDVVREFPAAARIETGHELRRVQEGLNPGDWKPMPGIGPGVNEIRVNVGTAHRVFYVAKFAEAVYVLHAITKKTQKTPRQDIELAARRFRQLENERKHK